MCFTELLRRSQAGSLPGKIALGDLYTYGSPRIGGDDFATALKNNLAPPAGCSWRISNDGDVVPKIPLIQNIPNLKGFVFVHVDAGYQLYKDKAPSKIPSEIGTKPGRGPLPNKDNIVPHCKFLHVT